MEVLVIGKPTMNIYLPLQEYPQEGEVFLINAKNESIGGIGTVSACLFAKWGIKPYFTGVLGNDAYGEKIRNVLSEYKVNSKFLETNFEKPTTTNYFILNTKTGAVTKILYNDPDVELTKFKYDFQPDWAILDGVDTAGAMALLNNDQRVRTVFYARRADQNTITLAKKSSYVICTQSFVEAYTKTAISADEQTQEYVDMYQKLVDLAGSNNYVVILKNRKILYCEANKVKMLPEMKINHADVSSFDSVFTGAFTYAMMKGLDIDDAVKFANTAAAISLSKIGEEPSIPTLDEALDNSGLRDKFAAAKEVTAASGPATKQEVEQAVQVETAPEAPQQPVEATPQVDPFAQQPVQTETPVENTIPVEQPVTTQPVEMPQAVEPVAQPVPVEMPQVQAQPQVPPHEETNIFG
ncbi:MAG: hypothetical protein K5666_03145 [Bacilli bacterium]|nr:hypothetical protein [Bacilli bacterium]